MAIPKRLKTFFLELIYKDESIIFDNVECRPDNLYVGFFRDGSYEVQTWNGFKEIGKATSAVVKAKWSCGKLQELADSLHEGKMEISRAEEILKIMRLDARDRESVQLGQGSGVWFD